jgi:hypothetical protein
VTSKASRSFAGMVAAAVLLWNILDTPDIPNLLDSWDEGWDVRDERAEERLADEPPKMLGVDPIAGAAGASRNETLTGLGPSICTICASTMSSVIFWPLIATIS